MLDANSSIVCDDASGCYAEGITCDNIAQEFPTLQFTLPLADGQDTVFVMPGIAYSYDKTVDETTSCYA